METLNFQRLDDGTWGVKAQGLHALGLSGREVTVRKYDGSSTTVTLGAKLTAWNAGRAVVYEIARKPRTNGNRANGNGNGARTVMVEDAGVYELDGTVYVVKPTRDKQRLYAKRLVEINGDRLNENDEVVQIEFKYAPGAIYELRPEHRMDIERAKQLTIRYGRCIVCSRHLKAAESVEKGIGPVCRKYLAA